MEKERLEIIVNHFHKYYSVWESALRLGGRILEKDEGSWGGPGFLTFEVQVDEAAEFESELKDIYEGSLEIIRVKALQTVIRGAD